jgi:hypothetical protein
LDPELLTSFINALTESFEFFLNVSSKENRTDLEILEKKAA